MPFDTPATTQSPAVATPTVLNFHTAVDFVCAYYAECEMPRANGLCVVPVDQRIVDGAPVIEVTATWRNGRGGLDVARWDVWVEGGRLYGEC